MIAFKFPNGDHLELPKQTAVQIAGDNPIFNPGIIPGIRVYNFKVADTALNRRNLNYVEMLNLASKKVRIDDITAFLHKIPWKKGSLQIKKASNKSYDLSFHVDTSSLALKIKNKTLKSLYLGSENANFNVTSSSYYPTVNHVFFPVYNPNFYEKEKNTAYGGVVNDYGEGIKRNSNNLGLKTKYTATPFPYLTYILKKIFEKLGYEGITGPWINDSFTRRVVIYNTQSLDTTLDANGVNNWTNTVQFNKHLPDISISDFLIEIGLFFGVFPEINDKNNTVEFLKVETALNDQSYRDMKGKELAAYTVTPNDWDGIAFEMTADSGDEILKNKPTWLKYIIGNGKEKIKVNASPLAMATPPGSVKNTIPHTQQKGISLPFEQGIENQSGLRFILFKGMTSGTDGNDYPQGNYELTNGSLRWAENNGLVAQNYAQYTALKKITETVTRAVRMNIAEFYVFNQNKKLMINNVKYLVKNYRVQVTKEKGIQPINLVLQKVLL